MMGVIGVDNLDFSAILSPPLTTIDIHKHEIGIRAAEVLLRRMEDRTVPSSRLFFSKVGGEGST